MNIKEILLYLSTVDLENDIPNIQNKAEILQIEQLLSGNPSLKPLRDQFLKDCRSKGLADTPEAITALIMESVPSIGLGHWITSFINKTFREKGPLSAYIKEPD